MIKKYIERTKDFFVQVGQENNSDIIKAIAHREMLGDKIEVNESIYYIQTEDGTIHKITEADANQIKNNMESQD